jgi:hypothetical protein
MIDFEYEDKGQVKRFQYQISISIKRLKYQELGEFKVQKNELSYRLYNIVSSVSQNRHEQPEGNTGPSESENSDLTLKF